jgi:hypothetical protein
MKVQAFSSKVLVVLGTFIAALAAVPASAQISSDQAFGLAGGHAYRNNVAYDSVNQVYLVIVQRPPVTARFYDKNGQQLGQEIVISSEGGYNAWASVAFGGTAGDPAFLVTYISAQGNNPKFGRLVRFNSGSPWVTGPTFIVDVGTEWTYAEKGQNVWNGTQFIVGSRVKNPGASFPTFQVNHFDLSGGASGGVDLGDGADYYGSPAIACAPNSTCLTVGYMAGIPTGYTGGSYGRLFHGPSLAPQGGLFYLSAGLANEDQAVVYQTHLGRFLTQWFRGSGPGYIDTRIVGTDGSMSSLDLNRGIGPDAGTNAMSFNPVTRTTLLLTKLTGATLWAIELGDDGYPRDTNNWLVQTMWDGAVLDYLPSIAANTVDGHWLTTWELQSGGFARIIRPGSAGQKAQLTSPATGSTLTSSTATFQWSAGVGVAQYWLYVGSSPGAFDIVNRGMGSGLSTVASGLPTSGQTLYVRLHSNINGAWQYNDYTLTAVTQFNAQMAQLVSPAPSSTLGSSTATIQWTPGTGVARYWLYIGTTAGSFDLVNRDMGTGLSTVVNGLPTNGSTLYVRLHSHINGGWQYNDYTLTAVTQSGGQKAVLTSPEPGTTLTSTTATFQWTSGTGVAQYWLYIGTTPGAFDILTRGTGTAVSTVVNGLPATGATLYVRLHSHINGAWQFNDYTLTASPAASPKAQLVSPAPGSTLNSTNLLFQWTQGTAATQYWLYVGTTPGTFNVANRDMGAQLSTVVGGIPVNGGTLYVRLHSLINGAWQFNDYTLTAPLINGLKAQLWSPTNGSTLSSTTINFQWTGGTGVAQYWLYVGSAPGTFDIVTRNLNTSLSTVVNGLPSGGQPIYIRLLSLINGAWQFNDYVLTATGGG